ncbi:ADP-glyceromanno-heptose 6-epimerase [Zavarzinella formosa]|uniref:ADP-glyceromanno-heptose 6-epimerase n=1 Tax=Zavarzinella formosa TaxID=360055 RepID=UPI000497886F|nr:ADP-glyceromanno-heptose 6-epimerase [Zavarzinella formosa]
MIAITGAAGFIGSNLAHRLAGEGHELLLVDHPITAPKAANWVGLEHFRFMDHDRFLAALTGEMKSLAAIFHLGACSSTTEGDWDYLAKNNVGYTRTLWDWCASHGRPFFYASSAATYGDGSRGFDDRTHPGELHPLNLYGKSKNDFDIVALAEVASKRPTPPKWAGLKFFNVYGPRETHKNRMASVVWQAHGQILRTGEMKLFRSTDPAYPDGGQLRDFVFVGDCVDHMIWLWKNNAPGGLYNSGTGTPRTFLDLVKATFVAMGREPVIRFVDMPADLAGKYQNYTKAEMSKLHQAGYHTPATTLEEGVWKTVAWLDG